MGSVRCDQGIDIPRSPVESNRSEVCLGFFFGEECEEGLDGGAMESRFRDDEVVVFFLQRKKPEIVGAGDGFDGDSPVGSMLKNGGCYGAVVARLDRIAF